MIHDFAAEAVTVAHRGGARAVRQFDLSFRGRCLGVTGRSGDGKTSLINALAGLVPYEGKFILDGVPLSRRPDGDRVEAVLEDFCVLKHKTVRENIAFPLKIRGKSHDTAVENAISEFGLEPFADTPADRVPGNVLPLMAAARLGLVRRDLYLLDDVMKPLRPEERPAFASRLKRVLDGLDGMIVYASSDVADVRLFADRIAVLCGGVLEQYGTFDELAESPASRRVAEVVSGTEPVFGMSVLEEENGLLYAYADGERACFGDSSGLLSRRYVGEEVQTGAYTVRGERRFILTDPGTDRSILS